MADAIRWVAVAVMVLGFCALIWKASGEQFEADKAVIQARAKYAARAITAANNAQERAAQAETWDSMDGPAGRVERIRCMEMANMWARVAEANAIAADVAGLAKRGEAK